MDSCDLWIGRQFRRSGTCAGPFQKIMFTIMGGQSVVNKIRKKVEYDNYNPTTPLAHYWTV